MYQIVGKYKIDLKCEIGRGASAAVYACTNQEIKEPLCVKILKLGASNDVYDKTSIDREISILKNLMRIPHPNIIKIYDIYQIQENETKNFYIFMEKCLQGHLEKNIRLKQKSQKYFKTDEILGYIEQIVDGYMFFYEKSIIHRDLKPENILFGNDGNLKISDFGLGKKLGTGAQSQMHYQSQVGTPYYASPQVLMDGKYSSKTDVYSLGIIVYHLTFLDLPIHGNSFFQLIETMQNMLDGKVIQLPEIKCQGSVEDNNKIKTFIENTITFTEEKRWDWKQIIGFFRPNSIINTELQSQYFSSQETSDSFQGQISQPISNFVVDSNGQKKTFNQQKAYEVRLLIQNLMARQELAQMVEDHLKILQNKYQRIFSKIPISLFYASISGYQLAISINLVYLIKNEYQNVWEQLRQTLIESSIYLECIHYLKDESVKVQKQKQQVFKDQDAYFNKYQKSRQIELKDIPDSQLSNFLPLISIDQEVSDFRIFFKYFQHFYKTLIGVKFKGEFKTIQDFDTLKCFAQIRKFIFIEEEKKIKDYQSQQPQEITSLDYDQNLEGLRKYIADLQ